MIAKKGSTKIVKFSTSWVGVLVLDRGHIHVSYMVKMFNFF